MPLSFDIFCRVIDNYGDIGVCWRLARRLASRPDTGLIRLWVDNLAAFARIAPAVQPDAVVQAVAGIEIRHWGDQPAADVEPADVIIEAFACTLPPEYVERIGHRHLWINLEYLSAEEWVESCHGRPSLQAGGRRKFFFFPGFTAATGRLLREPGLRAQRDAWQADPEARIALLGSMGVSPSWLRRLRAGARLIYAFCYPEAPWPALMTALSRNERDTLVLIPEGIASPASLRAFEAGPGQVDVHTHAFVDQDTFDRLLWSAELNLVRGEDSLARATWAGHPMIWQAYRQEEDTHLDKLDAWLARTPYGPESRALNRAWNQGDDQGVIEHLPHLLNAPQWQVWQDEAHAWRSVLERRNDLADNLVSFYTEHAQTR